MTPLNIIVQRVSGYPIRRVRYLRPNPDGFHQDDMLTVQAFFPNTMSNEDIEKVPSPLDDLGICPDHQRGCARHTPGP